jgi:hypothetical protein
VEDQVGDLRLLERRAERLHELVGQLLDEPDGVGEQERPPVQAHDPRARVERVEQPVAHADVGAGQAVEQRRLARVRVAGERDLRQVRALALGAHRLPVRADVGEPALERADALAGEAAVGLDLRLARPAGREPAARHAAEALEVRPQAAHAGEVVLELGELDLELALGRVRVPGEDVEDERGAVDDRHLELLLEVALLARRELVVAHDHVRVGRLGRRLDLEQLARAEVRVRVRLRAMLHVLADHDDPGRAQQLAQLGQVVAGGERGDQEGALLGARSPRLLHPSSLVPPGAVHRGSNSREDGLRRLARPRVSGSGPVARATRGQTPGCSRNEGSDPWLLVQRAFVVRTAPAAPPGVRGCDGWARCGSSPSTGRDGPTSGRPRRSGGRTSRAAGS